MAFSVHCGQALTWRGKRLRGRGGGVRGGASPPPTPARPPDAAVQARVFELVYNDGVPTGKVIKVAHGDLGHKLLNNSVVWIGGEREWEIGIQVGGLGFGPRGRGEGGVGQQALRSRRAPHPLSAGPRFFPAAADARGAAKARRHDARLHARVRLRGDGHGAGSDVHGHDDGEAAGLGGAQAAAGA